MRAGFSLSDCLAVGPCCLGLKPGVKNTTNTLQTKYIDWSYELWVLSTVSCYLSSTIGSIGTVPDDPVWETPLARQKPAKLKASIIIMTYKLQQSVYRYSTSAKHCVELLVQSVSVSGVSPGVKNTTNNTPCHLARSDQLPSARPGPWGSASSILTL